MYPNPQKQTSPQVKNGPFTDIVWPHTHHELRNTIQVTTSPLDAQSTDGEERAVYTGNWRWLDYSMVVYGGLKEKLQKTHGNPIFHGGKKHSCL